MATGKSITDEQIRDLLVAGLIDETLYHNALLVLSQHGSLGPGIRREARARCAEILSAKAGGK